MGVLPEILVPPPLPVAPPFILHTLWANALAALPALDRVRIVPDPPSADDLPGWSALGRAIQGVRSEIGGAGIDFAAVAERCGEGFLFNDQARWRVLARAWPSVLAGLEVLGLTDRDEHRRRVARDLPGAPSPDPAGFPDALWLVGVTELLPVVRQILERTVGEGLAVEVVVHAPTERAGAFDEFGIILPRAWLDEPAGIPPGAVRTTSDPAAQADLVVELLRGLNPVPAPEEVTIGVPDPELVPFVEDRLHSEGIATRDAAGTSLAETSPFRLLKAVADFARDASWDAFASLIRHPGLRTPVTPEEWGGGFPAVALLDRYHAKHLPRLLVDADQLPGIGSPGDDGDRDAVARALRFIRVELLAGLGEPRPLSRWPDPVTGLLLRLFGEGERDPARPSDRPVLALCEALLPTLDAMRRLRGDADRTVDGATALTLLLGELGDAFIPPTAELEAVELLGWLELHLDDAQHLFVTGVNEPALPASRTSDPFLPHALRARLGLPDNEARLARDLYHLHAILSSRPGTILISGARTRSGDPLRPSRLLLQEGGEALARRIVHLAHATPEKGTSPHSSSGASDGPLGESDRRDPFALPPEPVITSTPWEERLRVTDFRTIIADPYLFALERILRLETVDDRGRELDPRAFGSLLHRVLEAFSRDAEGFAHVERTDPKALRALLNDLLDRDAARRFGRGAHPAVRLQVELARARLHAFADWEAAHIAAGWVTRAVEAHPASDGGVLFDVDGRPVMLRGRIDRIDHHPGEGRWVLFDYKTSSRAQTPDDSHRKKTGRSSDAPLEWVDLQLPLYRHLVRGIRATGDGSVPGGDDRGGPLIPHSEIDRVETGYILLPAELDRTGEEIADWSPGELLEADERAREAVRFLRRGDFAWDPDSTTIRSGTPLAALVGMGAWRELDDEEPADD